MPRIFVRKLARAGSAIALAGSLAACQTLDDLNAGLTAGINSLAPTAEAAKLSSAPPVRSGPDYFQSIPKDKLTSEPRRLVAKLVAALRDNDLEQASKFANQALALEITNSQLQFVNGFVYHQLAIAGDQTKADLAKEGYLLAIKFDPTNWLARYHLGLLHMERKEWDVAQQQFGETLHYNPRDPGLLYNMAVASYYAQDPVTSAATLGQLRQISGYGNDPRVLQASAIVMGALNRPREADKFLKHFKNASAGAGSSAHVGRRLRDWRYFHQSNPKPGGGKIIPAQMVQVEPLPDPNQMEQPADQEQNQQDEQPADQQAQEEPQQEEQQQEEQQEEEAQEEEPQPVDENSMVIVDVVIIRTEETYTTSKGINLLSGLQLQFGGGGTTTSTTALAYNRARKSGIDADNNSQTILTRSINIPSITYSLNIANANTSRNEILARPTLVALNGQQSEFFSGIAVNAAAVGGAGDGSTVQIEKEIGVKLTVTPEFLEDGRIKLAVQAERTFLSTPNTTSINFTFRIDTSKTTVNANVAMNYGESLILSGLSEKETERKRDGVPGLQDTPGLQYLFSSRTTSDFQKSVLVLLTPRPSPYVFRSDKQKKKGQQRLSRDERVLSELQARYSDWFRPYPNWASVFHHMQANKLYREFRTGDVALEKWENQESRRNRLNTALDFLYY